MADLTTRLKLQEYGVNAPTIAAIVDLINALANASTLDGGEIVLVRDAGAWGLSSVAAIRGTAKNAVVAGGAAGDITVAGIVATDTLELVLYLVGAGVAVTDASDLTSEFTVAAGKINNAAGTATTGGKLLVQWRTF